LAAWFEAEVARVEAGAPIPDDTAPGEWEMLAALVKRWRAESNQGKSA
jgi:hypothetical protein